MLIPGKIIRMRNSFWGSQAASLKAPEVRVKHVHPYWLCCCGPAILNTRHHQKMKRISIPGLPGHSLRGVNLSLQQHSRAVPLVCLRPSASTQGGAGHYLSIIIIIIIMTIMSNLPHLLITDIWYIIDCENFCAFVFLTGM